MIHFDLLADIALTRINNPTAKVVLLAIARYANGKGECFPSRDTISADSCVPVRSVVRAIQWLEAEGHIRIVPRSGTSNFYVITSMEGDMDDDTRANLAHEEESNITKLDFSKRGNSNTTSCATVAHPLDTPHFLAFWHAYPKRQGKGEARAAFQRQLKFTDATSLINAAKEFARWCEHKKVEKQYIPMASTWLNQSRWEDELEFEEEKKTYGWGSVLDDL